MNQCGVARNHGATSRVVDLIESGRAALLLHQKHPGAKVAGLLLAVQRLGRRLVWDEKIRWSPGHSRVIPSQAVQAYMPGQVVLTS